MDTNFPNLKTTPCSSGNTLYNPLKAQTTTNKISPKIIGLLPPDFPPGINLLINFWIFSTTSSIFGGLGQPRLEPFPPPGGAPHGLPPLKSLSFVMTLCI